MPQTIEERIAEIKGKKPGSIEERIAEIKGARPPAPTTATPRTGLSPGSIEFGAGLTEQIAEQDALRMGYRQAGIEAGDKDLIKITEPIESPKHYGLFALARDWGRIGNASRAVIQGWMRGEHPLFPDPTKANTGLVQNVKKGLTYQEFVDPLDLWDELGPGVKDRATEFSSAILTGGDVYGIIDPTGPAYEKAGEIGLSVTTETVTDPITYTPGKAISGPLRIIGKGIAATAKFVDPKHAAMIADIARRTVIRSTGIPKLDKMKDLRVDLQDYQRLGIQKRAIDILKRTKPVRKNKAHRDLMAKLGEETSIDEAMDFVYRARKGVVSTDEVLQMTENFDFFHNPKAIKRLIGIRSNETLNIIHHGAKEINRLDSFVAELQRTTGKVVPTLGEQVKKLKTTYAKALKTAITEEARKRFDMALRRKAQFTKEIEANAHMRETLGEKRWAEALKTMEDEINAITPELEDPRTIVEFITRLSPDIMAKLGKSPKSEAALPALYNNFLRDSFMEIGQKGRVIKAAEKYADVSDAIGKLPAYIRHVASYEAVEKMAKMDPKHFGRFSGRLKTPKTAADITRKFVTQDDIGRPQSLEEIEKLVERGDYWLTEGAGGFEKNHTLLHKMAGKPKELAKAFDTDIETILHATAQQAPRAIANAEYLNEGSRIFGKTKAQLAKLVKLGAKNGGIDAGKAKAYKPLPDEILKQMPHLKKYVFPSDTMVEMLKAYRQFADPAPVWRAFDTIQNWGKSYTLFLFPWYHFRNAFGNLNNMHLAGFGEDFGADMLDYFKGRTAQMWMSRGNMTRAKRIKWYVKSLNKEIDSEKATQLALENGVSGSGLLGHDIPWNAMDRVDSMWDSLGSFGKAWFPGSMQFKPLEWGRRFGTFMENGDRFILFMNRLRKGDDVRTAAMKSKKFLGDYRSEIMTSWERENMARAFPFYRWNRFNIPMQVEQLATSQRSRLKFLTQVRIAKELIPEDIDPADLPEEVPQWIKDAVGVPTRRNQDTGELEFLLLGSYHPLADIDHLVSLAALRPLPAGMKAIREMTPIARLPVELFIGRSLSMDRPLRGEIEEFLGQQMDAERVNLYRNIRVVAELDKMDPFSHYHRTRPKPSERLRIIRAFGPSIYALQQERYKISWDKERREQMKKRNSKARKLYELMLTEED
jgi:hypothetical protein